MKVTKKRFMSGLSILCALMILIGVMPSGVFASTTETYNNNCIYFNISNIIGSGHNESEWNNGPVYVYKSSWNSFDAMTRISGTNVYKLDVSSWNNKDQSGGLIFTTKNNWNDIKASDYRRTSQDSSVNVQTAMGKEFSWNGSGVTQIDGKNTFDMTKSSVSAGSVIGGGETPTQAPTQSPAPSGSRTIYFDATLSKLKYLNADGLDTENYNMPKTDGGTIRYYATGSGKSDIEGNMSIVSGTNNNIYSITIPSGYTNIVFSTFDMSSSTNYGGHGESTKLLSIPSNLTNPCFFADTSDNAIYHDNDENMQRGGYWDEYGAVRDAEKGKGTDVVDIKSSSFATDKNENALYLNSTFYDYYTDYELNGNNRDNYKYNNGASQRNWVPFRQFDQALSDLYQSNNVSYPIYTGHFQPDYVGKKQDGRDDPWGTRFSEIASSLNLYGYSNKQQFFAINNSTLDNTANGRFGSGDQKYAYVVQGLTADSLSNGNLMVANGNVALPHFNEDFINGNNSKNTKLGEVFKNVAFPFTQRKVFEGDNSDYWWFDSAETTLMMRKDSSNSEYDYYLKNTGHSSNSENVDSSSNNIDKSKDTISTRYGFFPFNESSTATHANTYNYGFGTKIEFNFYVSGTTNQQFLFSGDDDVWVYVDDQLVLDVGGAHGQVSGLIDFTNPSECKSYVSKVKKGASQNNEYSGSAVKSVKYLPNGETLNFSQLYKKFSLNSSRASNGGLHKLTFYYMERGMWESNMKIAFNMPPVPVENELQITKTVDTTNTNEIFQNSFNDVSFDMDIKNLATHYGTASVSTGENKSEDQIADYGSATTGTLKPINGALYKTTNDTLSHTVSNGTVTLSKNETITFDNQFRTGSYISVNEQLSGAMSNLFTTNWSLYENGTVVATKENSRGFDDGRTESKIDGQQSGNAYNGVKPNANTMVFRSYFGDDSSTKLSASCENEVNVGSLSVKKTGDSTLTNQAFSFAIKFNNVGGIGASASTDTINFTLKCNGTNNSSVYAGSKFVGRIENGTFVMSGIPVGTQYTIYETKKTGVSLTSVNGSSSNFSFDSSTGKYAATGTITAKDTAYNYDFGNEKDVVSAEITKTWNGDTYNVNKHSNVPNIVYVTLEKSENNGTSWTQVSGYSKITLSKNNNFKYSIEDLEKYTNSGTEIQYRIREYNTDNSLIDENGKYNDKYKVTYSSTTSSGVLKLNVDNSSYSFKIQKFGVSSDTTPSNINWNDVDSFTKLSNATFTVTGPNGYSKTVTTTGADGIVELDGLETGIYSVIETIEPEGHNKNTFTYRVELTETGVYFIASNSFGSISGDTVRIADNEKVVIILPGTGGEGENVFNFALFGVIAIIISVGMWLLLNKKIKVRKGDVVE